VVGKLVWLVLVLGVILLLAQALGGLDSSALRDVRVSLPFAQTPTVAAEPSPTSRQPSSTATRPAPTATAIAETCTAQRPRFVQGIAALKAALGGAMGEPIECERVIDAVGNTEQRTSTGLAYYRSATNTVAFTNGSEHWALTSDGLVRWTGQELEPTPDAAPEG
jgi:hypothetical protein